MNAQNTNEVKAMAMNIIAGINAVEGFDPTPLAVDYADYNEGTSSKRLPVMAQLAWFRLRYPEGRIATSVKAENGGFVARVRVYKDYKDTPEQYLAEAEAFRAYNPEKPTVSPREWAQTAAAGIALRNAGFGLQFHAAGDSFDWNVDNELAGVPVTENAPVVAATAPIAPQVQIGTQTSETPGIEQVPASVQTPAAPPVEETAPEQPQDPLEQAMKMPCPIAKYRDKTLGDMLMLDRGALLYISKSEKYDPAVVAGAVLICEHALKQAG